MVFLNTEERDQAVAAAFQQNSLQRVRKLGDHAEVAFAAVPGRVFKAKVRLIIDATGQVRPGSILEDFGARLNTGPASARWQPQVPS